jgi:hypothetical protein
MSDPLPTFEEFEEPEQELIVPAIFDYDEISD